MKAVKDFLEKNGFKEDDMDTFSRFGYSNGKCVVSVRWRDNEENAYYKVVWNNMEMYSEDNNVYWLIGVLTYYGLMDKNYKQ